MGPGEGHRVGETGHLHCSDSSVSNSLFDGQLTSLSGPQLLYQRGTKPLAFHTHTFINQHRGQKDTTVHVKSRGRTRQSLQAFLVVLAELCGAAGAHRYCSPDTTQAAVPTAKPYSAQDVRGDEVAEP